MLNYELAFELWLQWIQPARLMDYYSLNTRQEGFTSILNKERVPWGGVAYNGPCIPWVWEPFVNLTFNLKHQMSLSPPLILMHRYLLYWCRYHVLVSTKYWNKRWPTSKLWVINALGGVEGGVEADDWICGCIAFAIPFLPTQQLRLLYICLRLQSNEIKAVSFSGPPPSYGNLQWLQLYCSLLWKFDEDPTWFVNRRQHGCQFVE